MHNFVQFETTAGESMCPGMCEGPTRTALHAPSWTGSIIETWLTQDGALAACPPKVQTDMERINYPWNLYLNPQSGSNKITTHLGEAAVQGSLRVGFQMGSCLRSFRQRAEGRRPQGPAQEQVQVQCVGQLLACQQRQRTARPARPGCPACTAAGHHVTLCAGMKSSNLGLKG